MFHVKNMAQCSFPHSVLCSKLSVNQSISLTLSKALLLSSPPLCCWHLLRLQFCGAAAHSHLSCRTVEWGNLLPSESSVSTYIGKGQALSHKTTRKITFPRKTNKFSLSYLITQPLLEELIGPQLDSKTEISPTSSL